MNKARMIFSVLVLSLLFSCSMPHHGTVGGSGLLSSKLTEMHDGLNILSKPAEYSIVFSVPETPSDYGLGETGGGWAVFEEADYG